MVTVRLAPSEMLHAGLVGFSRNLHAISKGRDRGLNSKRATSFEDHIQGAFAEYAVAKQLGIFWHPSIGTVGSTDLGEDVQVRLTYHENGRLLLHPEDTDTDRFILVTGVDGAFDIVGWCYGAEGKKPEFWKDPVGNRPAFFVPRQALHHIETLTVEG